MVFQPLPPGSFRTPLHFSPSQASTHVRFVSPTPAEDYEDELAERVRTRTQAKALAYAVILGLDFIFFSGLQINVADQKYSFKSNPNEDYPFQPGNASVPIIHTRHQKEKMENKSASLSLLSSVPPPKLVVFQSPSNLDEQTLIDTAVNAALLPLEDKQQLQQILESNPQVCTLRTGRTDILQHHIYSTQQVPIKQQPYRTTPAKQAVIKEHLEEMLSAGIVERSHSGWASPVVLVPKKDGSLSDLFIRETKHQAHRIHPYRNTKNGRQFIDNTRPVQL
ncbi:protease reverse transcriptase ribonuclease h [Labeo rohita]|uniref:Protease reverse transcriptase ribonuclease h n=1 Tax=Labeo rohita TaxID=84645 RepID=A0A498MRF4_LABRO|nr:protease reverse transcriptase ribonuclease h [Labeo rohita]